jgi:hypothetical protein
MISSFLQVSRVCTSPNAAEIRPSGPKFQVRSNPGRNPRGAASIAESTTIIGKGAAIVALTGSALGPGKGRTHPVGIADVIAKSVIASTFHGRELRAAA